jgi:16S rRNA (cytosine967-C5)-methyltransferase
VKLSAERLAAARLLMRVEEGAFASRLLAGTTAPATRVRVLETLRWLRALDAVLQPLCRRPLSELDAGVRAVLRLGLAEIVRLGLPPALATDSAVRLVKRLGLSSASGMVNAVLRKAAAGWQERLAVASVDVRLAHPWWLFSRWAERFGTSAAEAAMASAQEPAVTWVWFLDDSARQALLDEETSLAPHPWCPGAWSAPGDVGRLVAYVLDGAAYAQDPSSQLVAHLAHSIGGGGRLLDLCAAPGGKAALAVSLGSWQRTVAADRSLNRLRLMRPLLAAVGGAPAIAADVRRPPFKEAEWDLVLLDAPCSGTGTFRRHPELKWRLRQASILELAAAQRAMMARALELVAPGGVLLYATCSVEAEENEGVVGELPEGFAVESLESSLPPGVPWIATAAGGVRILPNPFGDGFTIHAIRRH